MNFKAKYTGALQHISQSRQNFFTKISVSEQKAEADSRWVSIKMLLMCIFDGKPLKIIINNQKAHLLLSLPPPRVLLYSSHPLHYRLPVLFSL